MKLSNHNILITGATGGIGQAIAQRLAELDNRLFLTGRNEAKLTALKNSLDGDDHQILVADLCEPTARTVLVESLKDFAVDMVINCAGINQLSMVDQMDQQAISQLIETNLTVPIQICSQLIPLLKQREQATIVNIGSILGSIGYAGSAVYCASKFGLRGFTESLRRELAHSDIQVMYFAPRATDTDLNTDIMQQLNQALKNPTDTPEYVAEQLIDMLKKNKKSRYLGWPEAFFVRLNSVLPSLVDNALLNQLATIKQFAKKSQ